jgi:hypothetical protein
MYLRSHRLSELQQQQNHEDALGLLMMQLSSVLERLGPDPSGTGCSADRLLG